MVAVYWHSSHCEGDNCQSLTDEVTKRTIHPDLLRCVQESSSQKRMKLVKLLRQWGSPFNWKHLTPFPPEWNNNERQLLTGSYICQVNLQTFSDLWPASALCPLPTSPLPNACNRFQNKQTSWYTDVLKRLGAGGSGRGTERIDAQLLIMTGKVTEVGKHRLNAINWLSSDLLSGAPHG